MELAPGGSLRDELKRGGALERPLEEKMADAKAVIGGLAASTRRASFIATSSPTTSCGWKTAGWCCPTSAWRPTLRPRPGATVLIGTPHYMAPEVLAGEPATSRSDVWALAVVLHEIFFGRRPERRSVSFDGSSQRADPPHLVHRTQSDGPVRKVPGRVAPRSAG